MTDHSRGWKAHTLHEHRDEDTLDQVVEEFDRDGFVIISGLLGPELVEMLREECMLCFRGVFSFMRERGLVDFSEAYRETPHGDDTSYEYPLGIGQKGGYREIVMRSPGRYEMAMLVDAPPPSLIDDASSSCGENLLGRKLELAGADSTLEMLLKYIGRNEETNGSSSGFSSDISNMRILRRLIEKILPNDSTPASEEAETAVGFHLINFSLIVATPGCRDQTWHADGGHASLTRHERAHVFNVFVPLVDVEKSGPTEVRPGTHYHTRNLAPMMLAARARKTLRDPVAPKLRGGDAMIFDYRLLHRGRANVSGDGQGVGRSRPVLVLTFARKWFKDVLNFPTRSIFDHREEGNVSS